MRVDPAAAVTVLVVTWRGRQHLPECLESLRRQSLAHRVLVVDNASDDGTAELLRDRYPETEVLRLPVNVGFAGGVAAGLAALSSPLVALLNDDAVAEPGWLAALAEALAGDPAVAAVTSRMLLAGTDPPRLNNTGVLLLSDGYGADRGLGEPDAAPYDRPAEVFGFSGGAALLRVDALRAVGGFPAEFFLYYEDTDTSWRLRRAGWRIRYVPGAVVLHRHSASTDQSSASFAFYNERNRLLMLTRCAPAGRAVRQVSRFPLTTASLAVSRLLRRPLPPAQQFRLAVRLRVLGSYLRLLPWALRTRREIAGLSRSGRPRSTRQPGRGAPGDQTEPALPSGGGEPEP